MTRALDRQAFELFDAVVELDPAARRALLDERCVGTPALRALVERMLAEDEGGGGLELGSGAGMDLLATALHGDLDQRLPERVGRYRVVRRLGRGGMGVVFEGEQDAPRRRVALKLMRAGLATEDARRRFRREAHLLGQLQHRGIAHVYEAGVALVDGVESPFIAMELVDGPPLDRYADQHELGTRALMELVARVCDAVQHAHQKGIIHRDLKPQNVLVVPESSSVTPAADSRAAPLALGQPKVLDFGVARLADRDSAEPGQTLHTGEGSLVGTLAYMSPEQVEGRTEAVDTRADIWALGVMLHLLVAGALPFDVTGLSVVEAARRIATNDLRRLSVRDGALRTDLETIVRKALEKEPARRYGSAGELADDLRRCLRDEPILARRPTVAYQLRQFSRRHRALVGGVLATALMLIGGLVAVSVLLARVSTQRDETLLAKRRMDRIAGFQADVLSGLDLPAMGGTIQTRLAEELQARVDALDPTAVLVPADVLRLLDGVNATNLARAPLEADLIDRAAARIPLEYADDALVAATLHETVARMYESFSAFEKQLEQSRLALDLRLAHLGEDDPATLETYLLCSRAAEWTHRPELALTWSRAALEGLERALGPDDPQVWRARLRLAGQLTSRDPGQAERLLLELIERARRHGDEATPALQSAESFLAGAYAASGRPQLAAPILERLVAQPGSPVELKPALAHAYLQLGRVEDAARVQLAAVEEACALFGDDSEVTIVARGNLAAVYRRLGRTPLEEQQLAWAYTSSLRGLAPGRSHRAQIARAWARFLLQVERHEECDQVLREALGARRDTGGIRDDLTADLLAIRARCLRSLGRSDESDADERDALAIREELAAATRVLSKN